MSTWIMVRLYSIDKKVTHTNMYSFQMSYCPESGANIAIRNEKAITENKKSIINFSFIN